MSLELPPLFVRLHNDQMFQSFLKHGPVVRVLPREPLGSPSDAACNDTVTLVTVRGINERGVVRFEAFSIGDLKAANEWAERHRETTKEEFEWLPSFEGAKS